MGSFPASKISEPESLFQTPTFDTWKDIYIYMYVCIYIIKYIYIHWYIYIYIIFLFANYLFCRLQDNTIFYLVRSSFCCVYIIYIYIYMYICIHFILYMYDFNIYIYTLYIYMYIYIYIIWICIYILSRMFSYTEEHIFCITVFPWPSRWGLNSAHRISVWGWLTSWPRGNGICVPRRGDLGWGTPRGSLGRFGKPQVVDPKRIWLLRWLEDPQVSNGFSYITRLVFICF